MAQAHTTDVLIAGGGVIGLSIARELHRLGVQDITVVEQGKCGREASWAAAGMLSPQAEMHEVTPLLDLCVRSREMYPSFARDLLSETGIDSELDQTGTLVLAFDDAEAQRLYSTFHWQRAAGLAVETMSHEEISRAEPMLPATVITGALFPNDWRVDNRKLVTALHTYADRNGINIIENTEVSDVIVEHGIACGVRTSPGEIRAQTTIVATGAWTSLIRLKDAKMPIDVSPVRGQIVCVEAPVGTLQHVVCTSRGYVVPRRDGRILVGSTSENVGFERSTTDDGITMLTQLVNYLLPATHLRVVDSWAGLRPSTPDGLPVIGELPGMGGLVIATGHYRNGILLAPLTAKLVAERVAKGAWDDVFSTFGPQRFGLATTN